MPRKKQKNKTPKKSQSMDGALTQTRETYLKKLTFSELLQNASIDEVINILGLLSPNEEVFQHLHTPTPITHSLCISPVFFPKSNTICREQEIQTNILGAFTAALARNTMSLPTFSRFLLHLDDVASPHYQKLLSQATDQDLYPLDLFMNAILQLIFHKTPLQLKEIAGIIALLTPSAAFNNTLGDPKDLTQNIKRKAFILRLQYYTALVGLLLSSEYSACFKDVSLTEQAFEVFESTADNSILPLPVVLDILGRLGILGLCSSQAHLHFQHTWLLKIMSLADTSTKTQPELYNLIAKLITPLQLNIGHMPSLMEWLYFFENLTILNNLLPIMINVPINLLKKESLIDPFFDHLLCCIIYSTDIKMLCTIERKLFYGAAYLTAELSSKVKTFLKLLQSEFVTEEGSYQSLVEKLAYFPLIKLVLDQEKIEQLEKIQYQLKAQITQHQQMAEALILRQRENLAALCALMLNSNMDNIPTTHDVSQIIAFISEKITHFLGEIKGKQAHNALLSDQIIKSKQQYKNLEAKYNQLTARLTGADQQTATLREERDTLQAQSREKNAKIIKLKETLTLTENAYTALQGKEVYLRDQYHALQTQHQQLISEKAELQQENQQIRKKENEYFSHHTLHIRPLSQSTTEDTTGPHTISYHWPKHLESFSTLNHFATYLKSKDPECRVFLIGSAANPNRRLHEKAEDIDLLIYGEISKLREVKRPSWRCTSQRQVNCSPNNYETIFTYDYETSKGSKINLSLHARPASQEALLFQLITTLEHKTLSHRACAIELGAEAPVAFIPPFFDKVHLQKSLKVLSVAELEYLLWDTVKRKRTQCTLPVTFDLTDKKTGLPSLEKAHVCEAILFFIRKRYRMDAPAIHTLIMEWELWRYLFNSSAFHPTDRITDTFSETLSCLQDEYWFSEHSALNYVLLLKQAIASLSPSLTWLSYNLNSQEQIVAYFHPPQAFSPNNQAQAIGRSSLVVIGNHNRIHFQPSFSVTATASAASPG